MYADFQSASLVSVRPSWNPGRETSKAYPIPRHYGDPWNILLALYKRMKNRPHIGWITHITARYLFYCHGIRDAPDDSGAARRVAAAGWLSRREKNRLTSQHILSTPRDLCPRSLRGWETESRRVRYRVAAPVFWIAE